MKRLVRKKCGCIKISASELPVRCKIKIPPVVKNPTDNALFVPWLFKVAPGTAKKFSKHNLTIGPVIKNMFEGKRHRCHLANGVLTSLHEKQRWYVPSKSVLWLVAFVLPFSGFCVVLFPFCFALHICYFLWFIVINWSVQKPGLCCCFERDNSDQLTRKCAPTAYRTRGVTRLDGARGKKQVWRPYVWTWGLSEANVLRWRKYLWHCWAFSATQQWFGAPVLTRRPGNFAPLVTPLYRTYVWMTPSPLLQCSAAVTFQIHRFIECTVVDGRLRSTRGHLGCRPPKDEAAYSESPARSFKPGFSADCAFIWRVLMFRHHGHNLPPPFRRWCSCKEVCVRIGGVKSQPLIVSVWLGKGVYAFTTLHSRLWIGQRLTAESTSVWL